MVIAITGGSGFIGKELAKYYIQQGDRVRLLSRSPPSKSINAQHFLGDLTDQDIDLSDFVKDVDILYHCAGEINNKNLMQEVHVKGTQRLIDAAQGKIARWVQLSSVGAYGACRDGVITENSKEQPFGVYEQTKTESDNIVKNSGIQYVILRPSNVFGLAMSNQSLFQLIKIVKKNLFFYIGRPGAFVNYVHVNDVVKSLILCGINNNALGNTFIISQTIKIEQMIGSFRYGTKFTRDPFRLPEWLVRKFLNFLNFLNISLPLTISRVDAITGHCRYDTTKLINILGFEFDSSLGEKFTNFSLSSPHEG